MALILFFSGQYSRIHLASSVHWSLEFGSNDSNCIDASDRFTSPPHSYSIVTKHSRLVGVVCLTCEQP
jgi:hypothetical protein